MDKDLYFVAVKVFLEKEDTFLILKDGFGEWDLPGGRLKKDEFATPLEMVVERKMIEEVGSGVRFELQKPSIFMRHERTEVVSGSPVVRIFAIGYRAIYLGGAIELRSHHTDFRWVDVKNLSAADLFTGGWKVGVEEYLQLRARE